MLVCSRSRFTLTGLTGVDDRKGTKSGKKEDKAPKPIDDTGALEFHQLMYHRQQITASAVALHCCKAHAAPDTAGAWRSFQGKGKTKGKGKGKGEETGRAERKGMEKGGVAPTSTPPKISALDQPVLLYLTGGYAHCPIPRHRACNTHALRASRYPKLKGGYPTQ